MMPCCHTALALLLLYADTPLFVRATWKNADAYKSMCHMLLTQLAQAKATNEALCADNLRLQQALVEKDVKLRDKEASTKALKELSEDASVLISLSSPKRQRDAPRDAAHEAPRDKVEKRLFEGLAPHPSQTADRRPSSEARSPPTELRANTSTSSLQSLGGLSEASSTDDLLNCLLSSPMVMNSPQFAKLVESPLLKSSPEASALRRLLERSEHAGKASQQALPGAHPAFRRAMSVSAAGVLGRATAAVSGAMI